MKSADAYKADQIKSPVETANRQETFAPIESSTAGRVAHSGDGSIETPLPDPADDSVDIGAIIEQWHLERSQLYESLLRSDEIEALNGLRNVRQDFLDSVIAGVESTPSPQLNSVQWFKIATNAQWFDTAVQDLLGADRYAKLIEQRDRFNSSLGSNPSHITMITSDW